MGPADFFNFEFTPIFGLAIGYNYEKHSEKHNQIMVILPFMWLSFSW